MTKMVNVHDVLHKLGYSVLPNYRDILSLVVTRAKTFSPPANAKDVQDIAHQMFGPPPYVFDHITPKSIQVFGTIGAGGLIDQNTYDQMLDVMSIPVAVRGVLMPDAHLGYAMPIGGVVDLNDAVSPSFVGFDIGCRMMLSVIDIPPETLRNNKTGDAFAKVLRNWMVASSYFGVGVENDGDIDDDGLFDRPEWEIGEVRQLKDLAIRQFGTSGAGNHFFDLVIGYHRTGERSHAEGSFVALMSHFGSRGIGHKIATKFQKLAIKEHADRSSMIRHEYAWLGAGSELGQKYIALHNLMLDYSEAGHRALHRRFARFAEVNITDQITNPHNFVERDPKTGYWRHRKGATPLQASGSIIPGSCTGNSYVVVPGQMSGELNMDSSSHGAGRRFSRTVARSRFSEDAWTKALKESGVIAYDVGKDESPHAYKDIKEVMKYQPFAKVVTELHPRVVVMGKNDGQILSD